MPRGKAKTKGKVVSSPKSEKKPLAISPSTDIIHKLGLSKDATSDKIQSILVRLMGANPKTWKAMDISESDFKKYNVTVVQK